MDKDKAEGEDEVEMIYKMALFDIKQRKEDMERKVREGQWVKNDYKVVHRCTRCADRTEKGLK